MNDQKLIHITHAFFKRLEKYSKKSAVNFDIDTIHLFRVEYKKLRAFTRMLSQRRKSGKPIRFSKSLKRTYLLAGQIRDLQLQQERIKHAVTNDLVLSEAGLALLQEKINALKPKLLKWLSKKPIAKSERKILPLLPASFRFKHFKLFFSRKMELVQSIFRYKQFTESDLHTIRKHLKDLYYNLQLAEGLERKELSKLIYAEKNEKQFKKLLDELGDFQDKCVAITLLKKTELLPLEPVKLQWTKEKAVLKTKLVHDVRAGSTQGTAQLIDWPI